MTKASKAVVIGVGAHAGLRAIADAYWHLHSQSRTAWTFELDLRPAKEAF